MLAVASRCDGVASPSLRTGEPLVERVDGPQALIDGAWVISFLFDGYLGIDHRRWLETDAVVELASFGVGLGAPRSSAVDRVSRELERDLAQLVGAEQVIVTSSTLHAWCDALSAIGDANGTIYMDPRSNAHVRIAVDRCRGRGRRVAVLRARELDATPGRKRAFSPGSVLVMTATAMPSAPTTLRRLNAACARDGATLIVDDTLGIGLWGDPAAGAAYGRGGRGSLARAGVPLSTRVLVVASLTKSFGIPLAFTAGSTRLLERIRRRGACLASSSPPDFLSLVAARRALEINRVYGDTLRAELASSVRTLDEAVGTSGAGAYPVRSWRFGSRREAQACDVALQEAGIRALVDEHAPAIHFVVTAAHSGPVLARAIHALRGVRERCLA